MIRLISLFSLILSLVESWPDGAPCVHAAFESMNPLEAVEHQGGLQLSEPPYEVAVDQPCFWANQPVGVTIQGKNTTIKFKGFAIQPFEWRQGRTWGRIGQFIRLDDNGSWQQQCFRRKDSATHSHDEKKKHIKLWWKSDDDSRTVQFVATIVEHIRKFWVKSVVSVPIPPCRLSRKTENWIPPMPTPPPSVKPFKSETHRVFGKGGFQDAPFRSSSRDRSPVRDLEETTPRFAPSTTESPPTLITFTSTIITRPITTPTTTTTEPSRPIESNVPSRSEAHLIELVDGGSDRNIQIRPRPRISRPRRPLFRINAESVQVTRTTTSAPTFETTIQQTSARFFVPESFARQQAEAIRRRLLAQQQEQIRQQLLQRQFQQRQLFQQPASNAVVCADSDSRCGSWIGHCQFNAFVAQRCPLSCGFCRFRIQ